MALRFLILYALATATNAQYQSPSSHSGPLNFDYGNLLIGRENFLTASSTCGSQNSERYCDISNLGEPKECNWCKSNNNEKSDSELNHGIQNIIYKYFPGTRRESWWQSENGKENVKIQLDLEAEFQVQKIIIQFKTFRPKAMVVERSMDGRIWRAYRYFAHNCSDAFPGIPETTPRSFTEIVCETKYSDILPSTGGEVEVTIIPHNINPNSEEALEFSKITNLRITFTKLHTLAGDIIDDRAEIREKYYYAINTMSVLGSCSCNGHSSRCLPMPGMAYRSGMVNGRCECTHNTEGINCEYCEDLYNDFPWRPANSCKRCTCNNHATTCHFDPSVFNNTGKTSGGVCNNCLHNIMGINCERCIPEFYRDPSLDIQDRNVCKACDCDIQGSIDDACDSITGQCKCRSNMTGRRCDQLLQS